MTSFVLLAGGKGGSRLKIIKKSKCLIKVNKETLLEKIYKKIKSENFKKYIINESQKDIINFIIKKIKNKIITEKIS